MLRYSLGFITVDYDKSVDRSAFDCVDHPELNEYIAKQATQDQKRNVSRTFMYLEEGKLVGYYTLATSSVLLADIPAEVAKGLPQYPIPALLLSRLAVDGPARGKGLGKRLMADVLRRTYAISKHAGVAFLIVDAKDAKAAAYYEEKLGFVQSVGDPLRLVLPVKDFFPRLKAKEEAENEPASA